MPHIRSPKADRPGLTSNDVHPSHIGLSHCKHKMVATPSRQEEEISNKGPCQKYHLPFTWKVNTFLEASSSLLISLSLNVVANCIFQRWPHKHIPAHILFLQCDRDFSNQQVIVSLLESGRGLVIVLTSRVQQK